MKHIVCYLVCALAMCGCVWTDQGSRTVVGSHTALPTISSTEGDIDVKVYESIEGAMVSTRKDSKVCISYNNVYTNSCLGILHKQGTMTLDVIIEPIVTTNCAACVDTALDESAQTVTVDVKE